MAQRPTYNEAYTFYVALESVANSPDQQINPTLATGDVTVSLNGSGFNNITTLPTVTPVSGIAVQVDVSASEMTAENVFISFVDASGAEWNDLAVVVQPQAPLITLSDVATSGALQTVDDNLDAVKAKTDDLTFSVANQLDTNVTYINETQVTGSGVLGNEWGPV